jgi:hypothetical protein
MPHNSTISQWGCYFYQKLDHSYNGVPKLPYKLIVATSCEFLVNGMEIPDITRLATDCGHKVV